MFARRVPQPPTTVCDAKRPCPRVILADAKWSAEAVESCSVNRFEWLGMLSSLYVLTKLSGIHSPPRIGLNNTDFTFFVVPVCAVSQGDKLAPLFVHHGNSIRDYFFRFAAAAPIAVAITTAMHNSNMHCFHLRSDRSSR